MTIEMFYVVIIACFGLIHGSFFNVVALRTLKKESINWPPSHCPSCSRSLKWFENIPVLSYVVLRGKCRTCKAPISIQYPLVEAVTAGAFVWVYLAFGMSVEGALYTVLLSLMIVITVTDLREYLIPNKILLGFGILLVPLAAFSGTVTIIESIGGALLVFALMLGITLATKGAGIGGGDIKLFILLGWVFGPALFFVLYLLSTFVGLLYGLVIKYKLKQNHLPFGPAIAIATVFTVFYGPSTWDWYMGRF